MATVEELEKRVQELEKLVKSESQDLSGKSYKNIGSKNANLILQTRADIKVKYGNVYVDVFKDGKLNVDSKFIYKKEEVGRKDGIYVLPDNTVVLKAGENEIQLSNIQSDLCVSFDDEQETTSEQKEIAQQNIGLIVQNTSDFNKTFPKNGFVYSVEENKFYAIVNSELEEIGDDNSPFATQEWVKEYLNNQSENNGANNSSPYVRYDQLQELTNDQMAQVQRNIGLCEICDRVVEGQAYIVFGSYYPTNGLKFNWYLDSFGEDEVFQRCTLAFIKDGKYKGYIDLARGSYINSTDI